MKIKKIILMFLILCIGLFVGCETEANKTSIEYVINETSIANETEISKFDLSNIKITAKLSNGFSTEIDVTPDMLSLEDNLKLSEVGTHTITITYKDFSKTITINLIEDKQIQIVDEIEYSIDKTAFSEKINIDDFDLSSVKILAVDANGYKEIINVTPDMLSNEDNQKLTTVGKHTITVNYKDFTDILEIELYKKEEKIIDGPTYIDSNGYYKNAVGKQGNELKLALRTITSTGYKGVTYNSLNNYLITTDASLTNKGKILLFYTRKEINGVWDSGNTWNKEHVWPRSTGWFQYEGAGCDAHHIRAVDSGENSRRGNKPYGTGSGYYTPSDEVKGDVARIIFYLLVRYSEADKYPITNVAQSMDMLLKWNQLDPVDDIERYRNEEVYKIQNNRNPFIDYSDYAYYIWDTSYLKVSFESPLNGIEQFKVICVIEKKKGHKAFF